MLQNLTICFTSDTHGYYFPTDFVGGDTLPLGLMRLAADFPKDGNTLILDGGDTLQGSPMTNLCARLSPEERQALMPGVHPFAAAMNQIGYHYVTLGNHDFNYGLEYLNDYLTALNAKCICCNIRDKAGKLLILPYAVHTLSNGLRVGLVGACTDFVRVWENPATTAQLIIEEPVASCRAALQAVRPLCDLTVLIYHGGYERDLASGQKLTDSTENQAWRICNELDFDIVLTGHQHMSVSPRKVGNSFTCQPPYRAREYCRVEAALEDGNLTFGGENRPAVFPAVDAIGQLLTPLKHRMDEWLDTPVGHLDRPLDVTDHLSMALTGCPLCNFVNTVLLDVSGAQIATSAMANEASGLPRDITIRNVVAAYIYSNTLKVLDMTAADLKRYMERCAEYMTLCDGVPIVSQSFLMPKAAHYNYDYFSGVDYTIDLRRPAGSRITSMKIDGHEPAPDEHVSVCITSYRFTGTGGFDMLPHQPVIRDIQVDIADAIIDYLLSHPTVEVDMHRYSTIVY